MHETDSPTRALADWVANCPLGNIRDLTFELAQHAVLDWLGVTLSGAGHHLTNILVAESLEDGSRGCVNLIGRSETVSTSAAALINGAASHVLDFDDVNHQMYGHPSVAVLPAVWALAQQHKKSGRAFLEAFIIGYEAACIVGQMLGDSHYERGWHATGTVGTLGAAAGAARLLSLDANQTAMALGIAGTQAAGLQAVFGTMCKPLHAGKAAMNGLMAARWAKRGLTSTTSILEAAQGLGETQTNHFKPFLTPSDHRPIAIESSLFKYHACCYFTQAALEALIEIRDSHGLKPDDVSSVMLRSHKTLDDVCNIAEPTTGLAIKFSIRHLAAMVLSGLDTGDLSVFTTDTALCPKLAALRSRISFKAKRNITRHACDVEVRTQQGTFKLSKDLSQPNTDRGEQWRRLCAKFNKTAAPTVGPNRVKFLIAIVENLADSHQLSDLVEATQTSFVEL